MSFPTVLARLGVLAASVAGGMWLIGSRAKAALKGKYPPPGKMIDIGGYRLHYESQGEGSPTVILEAGQGGPGGAWTRVVPEVSQFTRVVAYDRAGLGWSDRSPRPRTAEVMVDELHTLLERAKIPGPYVLVGWSTGGMNMRLFAHRYPEEVSGLVLVDPAHEEQFSPEPIRKVFESMRKMMPVMLGFRRFLVWTGLPAIKPSLLGSDPVLGDTASLPQDLRDAYLGLLRADTKFFGAISDELMALTTTHAQMRAAGTVSLGDLPLVVLSHEKPAPMMTPELTALMEETFQKLHAEMASLSTNGKRIVVENSNHYIPLDRPDAVADAIQEVVKAVRQRMESKSLPVESVQDITTEER